LQLYLTYMHMRIVNMKQQESDVEKELQRMDESYTTVIKMFKK
jgi:hypothetical protein